MRLNALSAGVEAPVTCFSGVIHSIFRHACNVSLESNVLLTLVSSEIGNLSHGIRLKTPPKFTFLHQLHVGQPVACRGGILRVSGSDLSADLRTASLWHVDLKGLQIDLRQRSTAQAWTVAWLELGKHRHRNGLSAMIQALSPSRQNCVTSFEIIKTLVGRAVGLVPILMDATRNVQVDNVITAIRPLIGLGPGLTPSGDDFIVGYLAGLWSAGGSDPSRSRFMSSVGTWLSQAAACTNAISRTYIKSAVNGNVSEPIATLAQRIGHAKSVDSVREATRTALQVGSTSGTDGVLGLLLGCIAWAAPSLSYFCRPQLLARTPLTSHLSQADTSQQEVAQSYERRGTDPQLHSMNEVEEGEDVAGQGIDASRLELAVNNKRSDWPEHEARAATRQLHTVGDHSQADKLFEPDLSRRGSGSIGGMV